MSDRKCRECNKKGPFSADGSHYCVLCEAKHQRKRKLYLVLYDRARKAAVKKLIGKHEAEYRRYLATEQQRLMKDA